MADFQLKRKMEPSATPFRTVRGTKRVKLNTARQIRVQPKGLNSEHSQLDVASFVKSQQYEIKALEESMSTSRKVLNSRAFQQVPRDLRRRTASHNVKRVPKRLRKRAAQEMKEDNTPTVVSRRREASSKQRLRADIALERGTAPSKATVAEVGGTESQIASPRLAPSLMDPPISGKKFEKRQIQKTWLPTHLYHSKRAHMTEPRSPLWRFALPLSPNDKCYRTTHRSSVLRGCIAWDTSYTSSIGLRGEVSSILGLLRSMAVPESYLTGEQGLSWRKGARSWKGWMGGLRRSRRVISKASLIWNCSEKGTTSQQLLVWVHPSAFLDLWEELLSVAKAQPSPVQVEDLRFEIGSIQITGPNATEALTEIMKPSGGKREAIEIWNSLGVISDLAGLPLNALLSFSIQDPRLHQPQEKKGSSSLAFENPNILLDMLSAWQIDESSGSHSLLDSIARHKATDALPSQKAISKRQGNAGLGKHPQALPTDPNIPVMLIADNQRGQMGTGTWTVLLPWKCVTALWYCLMHFPLSSGGNPRFGGLQETRQLYFENGKPWFPGDYPGTRAGWEWELQEREKRKLEWEKQPKGRRTEWESLDLGDGQKGEVGRGWACDWSILFAAPTDEASGDSEKQESAFPSGMEQLLSTYDSDEQAAGSGSLATVSVSLLNRGHVAECARIYRIPFRDVELRKSWLRLAEPTSKAKPPRSVIAHQKLALKRGSGDNHVAVIKYPSGTVVEQPKAGDPLYPCCPREEDLIGFITSGNYNLGTGRATGVGSIVLARVLNRDETTRKPRPGGLCIVRDAGARVARLARWEAVEE